jgi:serine/threonine protein kinase
VDTRSEPIALQTVTGDEPLNAHIIRVYDIWFHRNAEEHVSRTFIKMQKCEGTLAEHLNRMSKAGLWIEPLELTEIMIQILSGLCHCHKHGICHRDLKLSNGLFRSLSDVNCSIVCG